MNTNMWNWMAARNPWQILEIPRSRQICSYGRNHASGLLRPRRSSGEGAAAARACRRRQCHRRRGCARAHGSVTAATILLLNGIEPILQLTCRDRNRFALAERICSALPPWACATCWRLRGDDPKEGDQPDTKPVFDLDARGLLHDRGRHPRRGELPSARRSAARPISFWAPPMRRSIRRRTGSRTA